ncbi:uncharacterized protein E5676_scaffold1112G00460 [Cucumis melo var. makuwa]|uniref:Serine/threonine-protein kinase nek2 n=1 Tax=Cucumis melo var. makuwa TaxID=1194695 RepID=A0A5D3BN45_CUCMM|nr:uncharacterized protein E6C27_scaffold417G00900 [Cucumis melo var. makuwa]TYK00380.1 uncharacterized protein E5676_scaffold1112G00460 [Cucumis melo var. makuwa]
MNSGYKLNIIDHSVHGYEIRCSYHTKFRDDHRTVQNSGIMLVATTMQVSSAKDKNPVIGDMSFYGIIEDIWEDFTALKEKGESSTQKRKRGPTEMKEITHAMSEGQKLVIQYNELGQAIGQNATKLKSFIGTTVRFHVPITYSDWPTVPKEIKDKVSKLIEAGFVVDPRSKKTIIQNADVCFRQFKYRLTTTYVLPFLDDVEKLKFLSSEYSFTNQQHWTVFVASLLKEDFKKASSSDEIDRSIVWKQARMDRKGQISDEETKEVVNLIPLKRRLMLSVKKDILTRTLGGKDRPGILHGVGKYVTKKNVLLMCVVGHELLLKCVVDHEVLLKCCVVDHEVLLKCVVDHEVLFKCCVVDHEVLFKCIVDHEVLFKCVLDHKVLLIMKCSSSCVVDHEVLLKYVVYHEVLLKCVVDTKMLLKCVVDHEVLLKCVWNLA